jgi:hypothetical protein
MLQVIKVLLENGEEIVINCWNMIGKVKHLKYNTLYVVTNLLVKKVAKFGYDGEFILTSNLNPSSKFIPIRENTIGPSIILDNYSEVFGFIGKNTIGIYGEVSNLLSKKSI